MSQKPSLPYVCSCGLLRDAAGAWSKPETLPPLPHSHGLCPECLERQRHELAKLRATARYTRWMHVPGGRRGV